MMRVVAGEPGAAAQEQVKDTLRVQGYFLACASRPRGDLAVTLAREDEVSVPARLGPVTVWAEDVLRVRLEPERPLPFRAGQYVTLQRGDGLSRSYSIANLPQRQPGAGIQPVELHVRHRRDGAMSGWLASAPPGTPLRIRGPLGNCFYLAGQPEQPLVLAGTGTGIAPLAAVARDAILNGHTGPISIVHGAASPGGLYMHDELQEFAASHPEVRYRGCVLSGKTDGVYTGDIVEPALGEARLALVRAIAGNRAAGIPRGFLCGGSGSVRRTRKALFMAGIPLRDIFSDEFLPAAASPQSLPASA
jgi:CDP-4-dehydro-6-deoxyglucose reductase, E3